MKVILWLISIVCVLSIGFVAFLPMIVSKLGLHPSYDADIPNLDGKKALIIATNHSTLDMPNGENGKPTGLFLSELSVPFYDFKKANIKVDIASIEGGMIPIEPIPWFVKTTEDKKFLKDVNTMNLLKNSLSIKNISFSEYDIVLISGGWGASYDLGYSELLGTKITEAYYGKTIIGAICHGVLGLINAKNNEGELIIKGRRITGVTDKQIKELGITITPMHPETELKKAGANFVSNTSFQDAFANLTVIDDEQKFVTGQNQNAGHEVAFKIMEIVSSTQ